MTKHTIQVQPRLLTGRKVKNLRRLELVPASIFGKKLASTNIQLPSKEFEKLRKQVGESTLIYLQIEGENIERPVLVREVVHHPVTDQLLHVSFNQVSLKEKVTARISIQLIGEAPAEKEKLGILVQPLFEVEVEALPTDIPEYLSVNLNPLAEVGSSISVRDLSVDSGRLTIKTDPDATIIKIAPLAAEEIAETKPAETTPVPTTDTNTETSTESNPATNSSEK